MQRNVLYSGIFFLMALFFISCVKEDTPAAVKSTSFLTDANPQTGKFSYFSFKTGLTIAESDVQTSEWDFGMKLTTFIVNSGISGPGNAGVIIQDGVFDEIAEAPESGYKIDQTGNLAIKDSEWYVYNSSTFTFSPIAGKVFIFRTGDGKYAKMEILSATPTDSNGNPVTPPTYPTKIKYAIRYAYQDNGTRKF
jgi:hypothetical protein